MTILIYSIHPTGEKTLVAVAPDTMIDEAQIFCARRNEDAVAAGYSTIYRYDRVSAVMITDKASLLSF